MFLSNTYIYFLSISVIVVLNIYLKYIFTNKKLLNDLSKEIKENKSKKRETEEEQVHYLDLLDKKTHELGKYKFYSWGLLLLAIIFSVIIRGGESMYLFGFRVGFLIIIGYVIVFGILFTILLKLLKINA